MAPDELVGCHPQHALEVEGPLLFAKDAVEQNLYHQIAEFVGQFLGRAALDCVRGLVGLLDQMLGQALRGLLPIPGTSLPEFADYFREPQKLVRGLICAAHERKPSIALPDCAPHGAVHSGNRIGYVIASWL